MGRHRDLLVLGSLLKKLAATYQSGEAASFGHPCQPCHCGRGPVCKPAAMDEEGEALLQAAGHWTRTSVAEGNHREAEVECEHLRKEGAVSPQTNRVLLGTPATGICHD